jgi:hypothetical protein
MYTLGAPQDDGGRDLSARSAPDVYGSVRHGLLERLTSVEMTFMKELRRRCHFDRSTQRPRVTSHGAEDAIAACGAEKSHAIETDLSTSLEMTRFSSENQIPSVN